MSSAAEADLATSNAAAVLIAAITARIESVWPPDMPLDTEAEEVAGRSALRRSREALAEMLLTTAAGRAQTCPLDPGEALTKILGVVGTIISE